MTLLQRCEETFSLLVTPLTIHQSDHGLGASVRTVRRPNTWGQTRPPPDTFGGHVGASTPFRVIIGHDRWSESECGAGPSEETPWRPSWRLSSATLVSFLIVETNLRREQFADPGEMDLARRHAQWSLSGRKLPFTAERRLPRLFSYRRFPWLPSSPPRSPKGLPPIRRSPSRSPPE